MRSFVKSETQKEADRAAEEAFDYLRLNPDERVSFVSFHYKVTLTVVDKNVFTSLGSSRIFQIEKEIGEIVGSFFKNKGKKKLFLTNREGQFSLKVRPRRALFFREGIEFPEESSGLFSSSSSSSDESGERPWLISRPQGTA